MDAVHGEFRLRPNSPAFEIGFKPVPVESIGLVKDANREIVPPRRLLVASIDVMKAAVNGETITPAVVRYTLTNLGQTTEIGKETPFAAPMSDGEIIGGNTMAYRLKPFESVVKIVTVRPRVRKDFSWSNTEKGSRARIGCSRSRCRRTDDPTNCGGAFV